MNRIRQIAEAWKQLHQIDRRATLLIVIGAVVGALLGVGLGLLLVWWAAIPFGILMAIIGGLLVFGRRLQTAQFAAIDGRPGAAAAVLQTMRGQWFVTPAVAFSAKQDLVHRVVGRCGIVLVGEGSPQRTKALLAKERTRLTRAAGDTPITTVLIGESDGEVTLKKLQAHLTKLPRALSKGEVPKLDRRLKPLDKATLPIPKGIDPNAIRGPRPRPR